ncbi:hypothetical protein [Borreliella lanei]|uniref:hypothetical protein n=1 Tax=Borreliella lanei TaxID=373540 RepID=UPI0031B5BCB1
MFKEDDLFLALAKNKNLGFIKLGKNQNANNSSDFYPFLPVKLLSSSTYILLEMESI